MDALTRPFDPERPAHGPLVPFRLAILVPFGGAGLLAGAAGPAGVPSPAGMRGGGGRAPPPPWVPPDGACGRDSLGRARPRRRRRRVSRGPPAPVGLADVGLPHPHGPAGLVLERPPLRRRRQRAVGGVLLSGDAVQPLAAAMGLLAGRPGGDRALDPSVSRGSCPAARGWADGRSGVLPGTSVALGLRAPLVFGEPPAVPGCLARVLRGVPDARGPVSPLQSREAFFVSTPGCDRARASPAQPSGGGIGRGGGPPP